MVPKSPRIILTAGAVLLLLLLGLGAIAGPAARAETPRDYWESSADPPADYPAELLSVPGDPARAGLAAETEVAGAAGSLVSLRVAGSVLRPRTNQVDYAAASGGGCLYHVSGSTMAVWNTPLHLPQRSRVDSLRVYYNDTSGLDGRAWLTVYDLYGAIVQEWGVSSAGSGGTGFNDTGPINHEIDYSQYNYVLNWRPSETGPAMQLCGFRIFYTPPPLYGLYAPYITQ